MTEQKHIQTVLQKHLWFQQMKAVDYLYKLASVMLCIPAVKLCDNILRINIIKIMEEK